MAPPLSTTTLKTELVMQTTEHQRVPTLPKQRIATLLGEINVHLDGNGPALVCLPSRMMTGQKCRGQGHPHAREPTHCPDVSRAHTRTWSLQPAPPALLHSPTA